MTSPQEKNQEKKRVYNDRFDDGPELVNIDTDPAVLRKGEAAKKAYQETNMAEILKKHSSR